MKQYNDDPADLLLHFQDKDFVVKGCKCAACREHRKQGPSRILAIRVLLAVLTKKRKKK